MKLSELLKYKLYIANCTAKPTADYASNHLGDIVNTISNHQLQFSDCRQHLHETLDDINEHFQQFQQTIDRLNAEIDDIISSLQPKYFLQSYRLYEEMVAYDTTEYILGRPLKDVTDDIYDFINARIKLYDDWKYPGMIIRPGRESFIDQMVGCDPLYLVDQSYDLLQPAQDRFGQSYRNRLRTFVMYEKRDNGILQDLPDGQFGLVVAYNFFNFRPMEIIEKYLQEIFIKLRPGGTLAMTYNNCDLPEGTGLTECFYMCYTPGRMLEELARKTGYEIHFRYDTHVPNTWLELRKPGVLESIRGGQALAEVKNK
jgi:SAM-dependent methyltransferase